MIVMVFIQVPVKKKSARSRILTYVRKTHILHTFITKQNLRKTIENKSSGLAF